MNYIYILYILYIYIKRVGALLPIYSTPPLLFKTHPTAMFIYVNESSLKMMKNAFYSILKALFVLKIFKFLSFFVM